MTPASPLHIAERIVEAVLAQKLAPGDRLVEQELADNFAVSRTVVREAYSRLAARGLLVSRRGSGAYVHDGAQYRAFQIAADEVGEIEDVLRLGLRPEVLDNVLYGNAARLFGL